MTATEFLALLPADKREEAEEIIRQGGVIRIGPLADAGSDVKLKVSVPAVKSDAKLERRTMRVWCIDKGLPEPVFEYKFWPGRDFAFDFAWPNWTVALEKDGAVHRIKSRFKSDIEKFNEATALGWRVFHIQPRYLYSQSTADLLLRAMGDVP